MKILHVTDTHLGVRRPIRGAPPGWSRADDHLAALRWALDLAEREGVDAIVHSGDVFDRSRPPAKAVAEAFAAFSAAARRVPVVLIPGNHDRRGLRRWLPHPGLQVHDQAARVRVKGLSLGLVPFLRTAEAWARAARVVEGCELLVTHMAFDGAEVPGLVFRARERVDTVGAGHLPAGVRHIACGHLHPRQVTHVGGAAVVQPGSTERTSWTERREAKGVAVWTFGAQTTWRFVDGPARPMVDVEGWEDLPRVVPGAMVRVRGVPEAEVVARGGWPVGPPAEVRPVPAPVAQVPSVVQLSWLPAPPARGRPRATRGSPPGAPGPVGPR